MVNNSKDRQQRLRQWDALRRDPRPHGLAELARTFLAAGERSTATEVLAFAEQAFPASTEIARTRALLLAMDAEAELRAAKDQVAADPSARALLELADGYRRVGRSDLCADTLCALIERHGENGTALAWLGELRYERFLQTTRAADFEAGVDFLQRALAADREALKPRMVLAQFYFLVGARQWARRALDELLRLAPHHERARELRAVLGDAGEPGDEDLLGRLADVEERMAPAARLPWETAAHASHAIDPEVDAAELRWLRTHLGVEQVALIRDRADAGAAPAPGAGLPAEAAGLAAFTERAARRMDLGPPCGIVIEGTAAAFVMEMKHGCSVSVVLPAQGPAVEVAAVAARDALERVLRGR